MADGWQVDKVCYSVNHQEAKSIYDDENAELIQIANGGGGEFKHCGRNVHIHLFEVG